MSRASKTTELGEEIQCAKCKEFWPADVEFFYFSHGRPHSWCKACYRNDPKIIAKNERWIQKQAAQRSSNNLTMAHD
jgi:recombinational DNA repair protein (RecF pathway)